MSAQIKSTIRQYIVSSWLNGDERGLTDETDLQQVGLLDSFTTLELVSFLEESFKVQLDPSDINPESFGTLVSIVALVERKSAGTTETS